MKTRDVFAQFLIGAASSALVLVVYHVWRERREAPPMFTPVPGRNYV